MTRTARPTPATLTPPGEGGRPAPIAPLSYAIFLLARAHRAYAAELLRQHGLHPGQELLLMQLLERDHQTQAELLDSAGLDHSTLSKSLRRMEVAGLLTRKPSTQDRRALVVSLTAKGKKMHEPLTRMWNKLEDTTLQGVEPDRVDELVRSLHVVREAIVSRARQDGTPDLQRRRPLAPTD